MEEKRKFIRILIQIISIRMIKVSQGHYIKKRNIKNYISRKKVIRF
jgi:hypothetical protein